MSYVQISSNASEVSCPSFQRQTWEALVGLRFAPEPTKSLDFIEIAYIFFLGSILVLYTPK
jgi:hypothetical protein